VPAGVAPPVETVIVELPFPVTEVGLNDAEAPDGSPDAESATLPEKPLSAVIVAVYEVPLPWTTVWLPGVAETLKSELTTPLHELNVNEAIRVCQLKLPVLGMYSEVYQNLQSSEGSMRSAE
jgi:hypothetical protein